MTERHCRESETALPARDLTMVMLISAEDRADWGELRAAEGLPGLVEASG
jgi:hypothetical protein